MRTMTKLALVATVVAAPVLVLAHGAGKDAEGHGPGRTGSEAHGAQHAERMAERHAQMAARHAQMEGRHGAMQGGMGMHGGMGAGMHGGQGPAAPAAPQAPATR
jgi:hypothetical protein